MSRMRAVTTFLARHGTLLALLLAVSTRHADAFQDSLRLRPMTDPSGFIRKVEDLSKNTFSITSDFVQRKHLSVFSKDIISKGRFLYKKEDRLRWEYFTPMKYTLLFNKGKITILDQGRTSVFDARSNPLFAEFNVIMLSGIDGSILSNTKRFAATYYETPAMYVVWLKPLTEHVKGNIQRIELSFRKKDLLLMQLRIVEPSGDYSTIVFQDAMLNEPIPDATFTVQ